MKWFPEHHLRWDRRGLRAAVAVAMAALGLTASASLVVWQSPGLLLGAGNGIANWLQNAESGSGVEKALYRMMKLPGGEALYRRSSRETRPALTALIETSQNSAALYSLRALEDEQGLDFDAAEKDWKSWTEKSADKAGAELDLADFYERRLKPQEEIAALEAVGSADATPAERWTTPEEQQSWKAWTRALEVVQRFALPRTAAALEYAGWEKRYPQQQAVYEQELEFDLKGKQFADATAMVARYRQAIPGDALFPVRAEAEIAAGQGSARDGLAVFDRSFEPLWPAELVKGYFDLLESGHLTLRTRDALRASLDANPAGGADALKDAAKLFYIYQQQGQAEAAKAVLSDYRARKDAHGAEWSSEELYTFGRLMEQDQDLQEAARNYYALAAARQTPDAEEKGLAGLARVLLSAPDQPLRVGAGNLALYKSIANMDRGPGYLNGILSVFLNSQEPGSEYASEDQLAAPYFHRAKAAEIVADIDKRFPKAPERPELHAKLMDAYGEYGENDAVIREGTAFLAEFPSDQRRLQVALTVANVYSKTQQVDKESALYESLLKELAARADGVPLGMTAGGAGAQGIARSGDYAQVLDRYLSRLVALDRLPDALQVLRGEIDRNPQDPGLYERLAEFLQQNRLNAREEEVYQRAIAQFQNTSFGQDWYAKLARFYLREKRRADYSALSHKVAGIFSGTELETYLQKAPAPDNRLALEVDLYAHERFPHDMRFVRSLLAQYEARRQYDEVEKLLWQHWAEAPDLRDQLFELLSRTGRLDGELTALRQQQPEIDKADWTGLAGSNPAAERFWLESCLWQSKFEQGVGAAEALSDEYPADEALSRQASSLERSLAYFHPEDTDKAVAVEKRLLSARPADLDTMARIGDIYSDRGRMAEAAPYWTRMAEVHPGNADGYLQSATVFWDYFDFASASTELRKAREQLAQPALFAYQAGAIEESRGNVPGAIGEYVAGSLGEKPSEESRERLLTLARRPGSSAAVDAATAGLLTATAPGSVAIDLRASVLTAQHRNVDLAQELKQAIARTDSFDVLASITQAARGHDLAEVEEQALERQISLTSDPVHNLELRYQLVDLLEKHNPTAAASEVDAIYREHSKVLGVVRATVDYDWDHARKPQAVTVLLDAAGAAYPELKQNFQLEAARKLTLQGEYPRSKGLLESLLSARPLDASVEAALADNYSRSGDQAGLETFFTTELAGVKAAAMNPAEKMARVADLRRGMISAASAVGHWGDAVDQYIELINAYPADAGLAEEAALAAGAHGQQDKLLGFYRKTIEASPRDARWSIVLARLETALEDYPAAIDAWAAAIRVRPEQIDLYQQKADLEERLHRLDDAVADYQQLYKLSYRDPQWMVKTAQARARQGRNADTVKALEEAWINGRAQKAANAFQVATELEQWGMLTEARGFAEQGLAMAGPDLLVDAADQSGAETYARIMARLRMSDAAFTRLAAARTQAADVPLTAFVEQVAKDGVAAVTSEEWRKQRIAERTEQASAGFARTMRAMGAVVGEFYTPEEKAQFATWLQSKTAGANDAELRAVYLPSVEAAGLKEMQANLLWRFAEDNGNSDTNAVQDWLQLERRRVDLEGAGEKIEALADSLPAHKRAPLLNDAAEVYRTLGDAGGELRALEDLATLQGDGGRDSRFYQLLLAARPQELLQRAGAKDGDSAAQYLVVNGKNAQAFAGLAARSVGRPPVWKKAYVGLTGLYLRDHSTEVRNAFGGALGGDLTIGERVAHAADRNEQLAGEVWFYYGSRYGEYLDEEKDAQAESYLVSELEHTPESADAFSELADYSAEGGRPDAALVDYNHSLDLKSDQPAVLDEVAAIEWKQGRQAEAIATWQLAVKHLAAEMDARPVPESFWGDFTQVLGDAAAHRQYPAIGPQVDAMLRIYLARNGDYRADSLLEAGYHANGDSMDWLLGITAASSNQSGILYSVKQSDWVIKDQLSQMLRRIVELEKHEAQSQPGGNEWSVDASEQNLIAALLDENKVAEARTEISSIPAAKRISTGWLALDLRVAEADGSLRQLVEDWKKQPDGAPAANDLRNATAALSDASTRIVLRLVYQQAIDARQLTAPNFLGLAGIDLDEGDVASAVSLLRRLTLVSSDAYADTDSAAALLEERGRLSDAVQFLRPLAEAFPWNASYKVRLAVATLAGDGHAQTALKALEEVAADPKASYAERLAAATALKGHGGANSASGSGELDLVARAGCPGADAVNHPYFVAARMAAAACADGDAARDRILRPALAAAPENQELRIQSLEAAFAAGEDARALLAAEPILGNGSFYGQRISRPGEWNSNENGEDDQPGTAFPTLKPEDAARMTWFAIHAREKRGEAAEALALAENAAALDKDAARKQAFEAKRKRLQAESTREAENEARAPMIHAALNQDRVVRPRLLPGDSNSGKTPRAAGGAQ